MKSDTGPFAIVPEWVLDAPISDRALRLYGILGRYADQAGDCWPSRRTLAERMGCSSDSVDRAKQELVDLGALVIHPQIRADGGQTSNLYTLIRCAPVNPPLRKVAEPPLGEAAEPITRTIVEREPPLPPTSGGDRVSGTNPRAQGTNPRGAPTPDPVEVSELARRKIRAANDEREWKPDPDELEGGRAVAPEAIQQMRERLGLR